MHLYKVMPIRHLKEPSFITLRETDVIRFPSGILGSLVSLQVRWLFVLRLTYSLPRGVRRAFQNETKTAAGDTNSLPLI